MTLKRIKGLLNKLYRQEPGYFAPISDCFTERDLSSVPEDWVIKPPDFVGVTSPKSGTTWWYALILEHPDVEDNRLGTKELSYFYHFGLDKISEEKKSVYRRAFAAPEDSLCGEWSPSYLWYPMAIENLYETAPDTKVLLMLRNPVDRYLSHMNQFLAGFEGFSSVDAVHKEMLKKFWVFTDSVLQGVLAPGLQRMFSCFDRSRVFVLQYEKCRADPAGELARTYRFLGIDDAFRPDNLDSPVNKSNYTLDRLGPGERERLARYYEDDVRRTANLLPELDISLWPDFD